MTKKHNTEQQFQYFNKRNIPCTPEKMFESINKTITKITDANTPDYPLIFEKNALVYPIYKTVVKLWKSPEQFEENNYFIRVHIDRMFDYMSTFLYNHLDDYTSNKPDSEDRKAMKKFERERDNIITQFEKAFK